MQKRGRGVYPSTENIGGRVRIGAKNVQWHVEKPVDFSKYPSWRTV
jgi:hypothetical protein